MTALEQTTIGKAMWRIAPFLMICYFFCYLDRVNVSFAALDMNRDLGLTAAMFGFGAGILFWTYGGLEVPSNILMVRYGPRRWLARILITWGFIAAGMMFVVGEKSFYGMRLALGAAEAGLYPCAIFYLSTWFPNNYRARMISYFMVMSPIAGAVGAPLSTSLLYLEGVAGLHGWQWMFIIEGLPAVVLGVLALKILVDKPEQATFLEPAERNWLVGRLAAEESRRTSEAGSLSGWQTSINPRVLSLGLISFSNNCLLFGIGFFLPQIVKGFGLSNFQTGWVLVLPPLMGAVAMLFWGWHSDKMMERRWHLIASLLTAAVGTVVAALSEEPTVKMLGFIVSQVGMFSSFPIFIGLPSAFLRANISAAVGIALINTIGAVGAFAAPWFMGVIKDGTGDYKLALLVFATFSVISACIIYALGDTARLERMPEAEAGDAALVGAAGKA